MRKLFILAALALPMLCQAQFDNLVPVYVTSAFDGDGCKVVFPERTKTTEIRFRNVDAPECRGYSTKAQPYGNVSRDSLRSWIVGKMIFVDTSKVNGSSRDVYGRLLAVPYTADTTLITFKLVEAGLAWYLPSVGGSNRIKSVLRQAHDEAKKSQRGLWASFVKPDGKIEIVRSPKYWRSRYSIRSR